MIPIRTPHWETAIDDYPAATDNMVEQILAAAAVNPTTYDRAALRQCIQVTQECAQACIACADACLAEEMVDELTGCIRTLSNTADVCETTARVLLRRTGPDDSATRALLTACWAACRRAREVCEEFLPIHHHCQVSARACRTAELACQALLASAQTPRRSAMRTPVTQGPMAARWTDEAEGRRSG